MAAPNPRAWSTPGPDSFAQRKMLYRGSDGRCAPFFRKSVHRFKFLKLTGRAIPFAPLRSARVAAPQHVPMRRGSNSAVYWRGLFLRCVSVGCLGASSCFVNPVARLFVCVYFRAGLRREDPPNLNILLSGGKETN